MLNIMFIKQTLCSRADCFIGVCQCFLTVVLEYSNCSSRTLFCEMQVISQETMNYIKTVVMSIVFIICSNLACTFQLQFYNCLYDYAGVVLNAFASLLMLEIILAYINGANLHHNVHSRYNIHKYTEKFEIFN